MFRLDGGAGGDLFLKHGAGEVADAVVDEGVRLRWLAGHVPCARVRALVAEGDGAWLLTDALPGRSGDGWLAHDARLLPEIVDAFAGFLRLLHALPADECPFRADLPVRLAHARRLVAEGRVDEDDFDPDHRGLGAAALLARVEALAPVARPGVVTHGDLSLGNLILDRDPGGVLRVTGCIDVGRLGIADPYQDVAILWQNLAEHGPEAQRRFLDGIGIGTPDRDRLALHRLLDELF